MSKSHADLVDLVQRGYRFAFSLTHHAAWAEDLVQDAWLSVLRAGGPWSRQYMFAAIRNRFVDECRRRQIVSFETLDEQSESNGATADSSASDVWDDAIDAAGLERALGALRSEERAVLFLAAVEGYTAREIADLLGCPRGSVLSLMHRARGRAREYLRGPEGAKA
jgi:RNA polymerase sigma-70 factor (ECF subfamily)